MRSAPPTRIALVPTAPSHAAWLCFALLCFAWLQGLDKFIIRMVNTCGRVHPAHLAVVMSKRLFLKRNLPAVCRGMIACKARELLHAIGMLKGKAARKCNRAAKGARWVK